ncbi:hypothetical protein OPV22_019507 [Ensete ventricosum]|uniref:Uncharacterized protein n=1 Tax=Ensete ventricosum TaxID=4639 RepID=A0AAV8QL11_ENSVE|nr:hypothetical protein OPV22_019507 [Ensete ventricosum]
MGSHRRLPRASWPPSHSPQSGVVLSGNPIPSEEKALEQEPEILLGCAAALPLFPQPLTVGASLPVRPLHQGQDSLQRPPPPPAAAPPGRRVGRLSEVGERFDKVHIWPALGLVEGHCGLCQELGFAEEQTQLSDAHFRLL